MKILAIETSCDDTCAAVLEANKQKIHPVKSFPSSRKGISPKAKLFHRVKILSNVISSQVEIHKKYGGIYPTMAVREHKKNLEPVFKKAMRGIRSVDAVAATIGPGLEPCLWVGVNFVKDLACSWDLPIIPVNHIEAHILANFIDTKYKIQNTKYLFPAVCLVVSGGHTQMILMRDIGKYKILGETRDDAAGECFDKTARILGLPYPGGPVIAKLASQWKSQIPSTKSQTNPKHQIPNSKFDIKLPRPMIYSKDYDFSFSGLKTAVLYDFKKRPIKVKKSEKYIQEMCREIQQAIIDVLISKTIKAAKDYRVKSILLGGGVAANKELRKQFKERIKREKICSMFYVPCSMFCTDNAAMIGITAYYHKNQKTKKWKQIKVNANLRI